MANGAFQNGNKTQTLLIILAAALGSVGSFGTLNSTDLEQRFNQANDNLDEVLQREMRLLTGPHESQISELQTDMDNMRDRMNYLENLAASNRAYIESLQKDVERLKGNS